MSERTPTERVGAISPTGTAMCMALLMLMAVPVVVFIMRVSAPVDRLESFAPQEGRAVDAMLQAVAPEQVGALQREIVALGNRFLGDPGHAATAAYIRNRFEARVPWRSPKHRCRRNNRDYPARQGMPRAL